MTMLTEQSKPWYKYPLVWMMVLIPFTAVIMGVVMIWLAVDTDDGLVADDYYKLGLEINDVISLDRKASELKLSAVIDFDSVGKVINLKFDKGLLESYPDTLQFSFQHATHAGSDVLVALDHGIDDQYIGHLQQAISKGVWYFEVSDADWKLNARSYVRAKNIIHLYSE
ncbi:MAG: hypothetical protein GQ572_05705 [Gammaproteobacteria bacterium]|nr:hypothetical protein [Gammaproteobacteria bacterium]